MAPDGIVVWMGTAPEKPAASSAEVAAVVDVAAIHPIAALALARLRCGKPDRKNDIVAPGCLGIRVLPDTVDRAILIADALIREFERKGYDVGTDASGEALVVSDNDVASFSIREDPITGRLSLVKDGRYRGRKTWSDGVRTRVEKQLSSFIASIEIDLAQLRQERIKREERESFVAHLRSRKDEREHRAEEERQAAKSIWRAVSLWEKADRLRKFASAADTTGMTHKSAAASEMASAARSLADRLDPLIPGKPPELATADYMKFDEWYRRVLTLLGKPDGYKRYGAQRVFDLRMTPEEAVKEVDFEAFWG